MESFENAKIWKFKGSCFRSFSSYFTVCGDINRCTKAEMRRYDDRWIHRFENSHVRSLKIWESEGLQVWIARTLKAKIRKFANFNVNAYLQTCESQSCKICKLERGKFESLATLKFWNWQFTNLNLNNKWIVFTLKYVKRFYGKFRSRRDYHISVALCIVSL